MKKYFFLLLSLVWMTACTPDTNSTGANVAGAAGLVTGTKSNNPPQTGNPVKVDPDILSPYVGIWHYQSIAVLKDAKTRDLYAGRWIDLKGDQTFTSGVWQEQTNSGKWDFNPDSKIINFFYEKDEGLDYQYSVNGPDNEIIIFMGNTPKNRKGIQIKMVRYAELPVE